MNPLLDYQHILHATIRNVEAAVIHRGVCVDCEVEVLCVLDVTARHSPTQQRHFRVGESLLFIALIC